MTKKETLLDKGIDVLVVVVGILLALSIDSCRENQKSKRQWKVFSSQFLSKAKEYGDSYPEIIDFYNGQKEKTDKALKEIYGGSKGIDGLGELLSSMGSLQVEYPDSTLYKAFVNTGNEYLINDTEKLRALGAFYSFETLAMTNVKIFY